MNCFKLFSSALVLTITTMSGAHAQVEPKPKVVVIPLLASDANIVYSAILPISINTTTNTISFIAPNYLTVADSNMQPSLGLNYICALQGIYPSRNWSEPTLAQVSLFAGNFPPRGWAFCSGQLLPIAQNQALFSLLGTAYGGDGRTTFGLPDLRGRVAIGSQGGFGGSAGPGLTARRLGGKLGKERISP